MSIAVAGEPHVVHALSDRVRIHLPEWTGGGPQEIETHLRQLPGIHQVRSNPLTSNILITFDPAITDEQTIVRALSRLNIRQLNAQPLPDPPPPALREKIGKMVRARIAVRGLDRNPHLARRVIEALKRHPGVHATVNPLTGRVLVEFEEHQAELDEVLATLTKLELPELPDEDRPTHPLDPGPLVQSTTRTVGAGLGLTLLATRHLFGFTQPLPGSEAALHVASILGLLHGIPPLRYGLRRWLGRTTSDLLFAIPGILTLTLAESPLGLTLNSAEALRLLTEVVPRRSAWRKHEERVSHAPSAQPGTVIQLHYGERTPLAAKVLEGTGTAIGKDSMPLPVTPGSTLPAGARLLGSSFVLQLSSELSFEQFTPPTRPAPITPRLYERYQRFASLGSLIYAGTTALLTRSFSQTLAALVLVNPRTATIGADCADLAACARVLREGVTVVGTRPRRSVRLPDLVLLDGTRLLAERLEVASVVPLTPELSSEDLQALAAEVMSATGFPWGGILKPSGQVSATDGTFDGKVATASLAGERYTLGPVEDWSSLPQAAPLRQLGNYVLVLQQAGEHKPLGLLALHPQLAVGVQTLVQICRSYHVELAVLADGDQIAIRALAQRAQIAVVDSNDAVDVIQSKQQAGKIVFFISDNVGAAEGFAASDLAIGLTDDRYRLPARADLLAPDLNAVTAIIEAAARRDATVRDSVGLSAAANIFGAIWGIRGLPGIRAASNLVYISALTAIFDGWLRLRKATNAPSTHAKLIDPQPERWGRRSVEEVLQLLRSTEDGLTTDQAMARRQKVTPKTKQHYLFKAVLDQLHSPLIAILGVGAGISLLFGAVGDVVIIGGTILVSVAISTWQDQKAFQVSAALEKFSSTHARVMRDDQVVMIPASEVVPGDVLLLAPGDKIAADARIISSQGLEVDEAALTGESLPAEKVPTGMHETNRIVLEGTDVTTGTGQAMVVAVGLQTRMGATRAALAENGIEASPLGVRLSRMLRALIPVSIAGGLSVVSAGLLRGQALTSLLALGITVALASVPEGLPLLAKVGEAGVARRLSDQQAVVRRLSAIEALGRVDVACADKTGTMTRGRLQLSLVATINQEAKSTQTLSPQLRHILLAAAIASPAPDAPGAESHPTDFAIIQGAQTAGMDEQLDVARDEEFPFDPARGFHATRVQEVLYLKGAPEILLPRSCWVMQNDKKQPLDDATRHAFTERTQHFAERGLRVLAVAEGNGTELDDPQDLTLLGIVGISDPLRDTVRAAIQRCHEAGVRVIMITGDHPSTAGAIAQEAGLLNGEGEVLTANQIAELQNGELSDHLERAVVIARATPLDKLRIIECLRQRGHTVAMTGDGVNDAPALRLADVGVAMGKGSTEVARQTADVVITDDDFSTLVEAFVEGRSFWRNIRRALALLLGGNLGELGLIVGASFLGASAPLNTRQILAVNAITDILPALAVALQQPAHRNLADLSREGASALGTPLRNEILRRALATTLPSLASYLFILATRGVAEARAVAFANVVITQLAQTLDAGRAEGGLTKAVFGAVFGSLGVLALAFLIPVVREFFSLVLPSPFSWLLIGGSALVAVLLSRWLPLPQITLTQLLGLKTAQSSV